MLSLLSPPQKKTEEKEEKEEEKKGERMEKEKERVCLFSCYTRNAVYSLSLSFFLLLAADIQAHCSDRPLWARCRFVHAILSYYKAAISGPLSCLTLVDTAQCSLFWLATGRKPTP